MRVGDAGADGDRGAEERLRWVDLAEEQPAADDDDAPFELAEDGVSECAACPHHQEA